MNDICTLQTIKIMSRIPKFKERAENLLNELLNKEHTNKIYSDIKQFITEHKKAEPFYSYN